jgi:hypothetical protein
MCVIKKKLSCMLCDDEVMVSVIHIKKKLSCMLCDDEVIVSVIHIKKKKKRKWRVKEKRWRRVRRE